MNSDREHTTIQFVMTNGAWRARTKNLREIHQAIKYSRITTDRVKRQAWLDTLQLLLDTIDSDCPFTPDRS